jgi:hypothetical protein
MSTTVSTAGRRDPSHSYPTTIFLHAYILLVVLYIRVSSLELSIFSHSLTFFCCLDLQFVSLSFLTLCFGIRQRVCAQVSIRLLQTDFVSLL